MVVGLRPACATLSFPSCELGTETSRSVIGDLRDTVVQTHSMVGRRIPSSWI